MGMRVVMFRDNSDARDYKKAVKMAKHAIDIICELTEKMEDQYGGESEMDDMEFEERRFDMRSEDFDRRDGGYGRMQGRRGRNGRYM